MVTIPDTTSVATAHWLEHILGRKVGPSTGTNLFGALQLAVEMKKRNQTGSIVTLLCDSGERYLDSYHNLEWVKENIGDLDADLKKLSQFEKTGKLD